MKLKKHSRFYTITGGLVLIILWIIWGNLTIRTSQVKISDSHVPEAFDGFKIAHLSDIHDKNWGQALILPIQEENPDIIVITGDLIDSRNPDIYNAAQLTEELNEIAPVYFVTGNHEAWSGYYDLLEESMLNQNVHILDNDTVKLQRNGEEILLVGLQDPAFASESNLLNEQSSIVVNGIEELTGNFDGYKVLLSHRPELFESYVRNEMNLVLSGHAHGGQIHLPFIGGVVAPDQGFFPKYTSGVYEEEDTQMVVSRGLGNSILPIRINNRPELIIIQLKNEL